MRKIWIMFFVGVVGVWIGGFIIGHAIAQRPTPTMKVDLSWSGWGLALRAYSEERALDRPYTRETLTEAFNLFVRAVDEKDHDNTVHWTAVRLVCETMKITRRYNNTRSMH